MRWQSVVGLVLLLIGSLLAFLFPAVGWIDLPQAPGQPIYQVHAAALSIPGLAMGLGVALARPFVDTGWDAPERASDLLGATLIVVTMAMSMMLIAAVVLDKLSPVTAALVLVMATITLLIAVQTLSSVAQSDGVAFDSHWGGLGGGLGGWRLSKTATLMLLLLVFASATIAVALYAPPAAQDEAPDPKAPPAKTDKPKGDRKTTPVAPAAPAATSAAPAAKST